MEFFEQSSFWAEHIVIQMILKLRLKFNDIETALKIQKELMDEIENGIDEPSGHAKLEIAECYLLLG